MYTREFCQNTKLFNGQYLEIFHFLSEQADSGFNEHFHWARFEWMMVHTMLETEMLPKIAIFRDGYGKIAGITLYDTKYRDRWYLIHSSDDTELLHQMVQYVIDTENGNVTIKSNTKDAALNQVLQNLHFEKQDSCGVLQLDTSRDLTYRIPDEFQISAPDFTLDWWQYQLVIYKGFDHEGIPEKWSDDVTEPSPNFNLPLKVFAVKCDEYCAHCGVWYTNGQTAYIEPVVTIPDCRRKGLAKAVVYEAVSRAKALGAKRAVVLSDMEFYYRIGFEKSSEVCNWKKQM